ncbi:MAG TPA: GNAT family N-acetyltransferase [Pyrinomonadaceae bacterium]|jgi:N-acetylglutamate synthase-like GNAT family acetyltransferase|nr:GNAT family N-acetyltransferase [Pyrinomonadaceae bacterium]
MKIEIRRAHPNDAEVLTAIAHAAKRHWDYPEDWIEQWKIDLTITPEFISEHEVFVALVDQKIVGCCALVLSDSLAEIEHMWMQPEHMGTGIGRALFEHAKRRAEERGAEVLELSADPNAEGFYARMGAERIAEIAAGMNGDESRVLTRMSMSLNSQTASVFSKAKDQSSKT